MKTVDSIVDISESKIINHLLSDRYWREFLTGIKGISNNSYDFQMEQACNLPGGADKDGDVDIILCSPSRPDLATAIQVKRIKVRPSAAGGDKVNRLHEFKKAVEQTNRIIKFGFSQMYLFVFVVIDSRKNNAEKVSYEGLTQKLEQLINSKISAEGLDGNIGLLRYDFIQPMDYPPFSNATADIKLVRLAKTRLQKEKLTIWMKNKLENIQEK